MVSYPCGPPPWLDTGMSMVFIGSRLMCPLSVDENLWTAPVLPSRPSSVRRLHVTHLHCG